jgi:hypothetical protein
MVAIDLGVVADDSRAAAKKGELAETMPLCSDPDL